MDLCWSKTCGLSQSCALLAKQALFFFNQRDPKWISSSVVSNWTWCSVMPSCPALIIAWEVMSQETGLSDTLTFPLLKSTGSQMSLIITWQLRVSSSSTRGMNVRHTVLPLMILSREERLSLCSRSKKERIRYMVVVQTTYSSLDPFEQTVVLMPALWVDN